MDTCNYVLGACIYEVNFTIWIYVWKHAFQKLAYVTNDMCKTLIQDRILCFCKFAISSCFGGIELLEDNVYNFSTT